MLEDPCKFDVSFGRRQIQRSRPIPVLRRGDSEIANLSSHSYLVTSHKSSEVQYTAEYYSELNMPQRRFRILPVNGRCIQPVTRGYRAIAAIWRQGTSSEGGRWIRWSGCQGQHLAGCRKSKGQEEDRNGMHIRYVQSAADSQLSPLLPVNQRSWAITTDPCWRTRASSTCPRDNAKSTGVDPSPSCAVATAPCSRRTRASRTCPLDDA